MKIYLAGPDVFRLDAVATGGNLKRLCASYGHEGLYPLDNEIHPPTHKKIFEGNVDMIRKADVILANISPFRGPGMDPGTAWEIGMGFALNKKILLYSTSRKNYGERVGIPEPPFVFVEDFELKENLMIIDSTDLPVFYSPEEALASLEEK